MRLSKLETLQARETFQAVALETVLKAATDAQHKQAKKRDITISTAKTTLIVPGDQAALNQLVTILLDNALKYSPNGSAIAVAVSQAGQQAVITITDQGKGIDPASLAHVFDRFYRADNSRGSDGYGLGLSLAKMITELHGGAIALTSQGGKGTVATIKLPLATTTPAQPQLTT